MERVFLLPGEYHVARTHCVLATLLGSCVGVCLRHISKPYAALNHFLLAKSGPGETNTGRYGDLSIETIIRLMRQLDPTENTLRARIYGGAKVVDCLSSYNRIGETNVALARNLLARHRIPVEAEDVGGSKGRRIYFDTAKVQVRVEIIQGMAAIDQLALKQLASTIARPRI
jgi:chemotaxis protein CheD